MTEPPFTTRHLGAIKAAAVIMAVLIIVLTAVLVATIISRLSGRAAPPDAAERRFPPEPSCARQAPPTMAMSSLSIRRTARKSGGSPSGKRLHVISVTQE